MENKPTLDAALAVPGVAHVVGETNGTYTAYIAGEELPAHACVEIEEARLAELQDSDTPPTN